MRQITLDQSHQVMSTLAVNTNWDEIDFEGMGLQDSIIRNPKEAGRQFTNFLKNGGRIAVQAFPIFRTIKLGTGLKTADDFRKAIKDKRMRIGDYANDILGKPQFTVATEETEVDLVIVSVEELGYKNGAKLNNIYARAEERGLQRCPSEVGPQLRLQYTDQPKDERLIMGMKPITGSDGSLDLFRVAHDDRVLWLYSRYVNPDDFWSGYSRFVFVLPRK